MAEEACCTCATLLSQVSPQYDSKTEKPTAQERTLDCCGRTICSSCITNNSRFATYCPFCQISILPTALPQGLSDPPAYSPPELPCPSFAALNQAPHGDSPPTYASISRNRTTPHDSKPPHTSLPAPDVLHFIGPFDTLQSLSLAYSTPVSVLRSTNNLFSDHLLAARRTILVPGEFYKGGVSLSPRPVEGEEEEIRRGKIRRWMVACKVAEYDIALLYLQQADYDLNSAVAAYKADENWERDHPINSNIKAKAPKVSSRQRMGGLGMTGQLN